MSKYLRKVSGETFTFVVDGLHMIEANDIKISDSDYEVFLNLQSQGKQFRVREIPQGPGLFDHLEVYDLEPLPILPTETELLQEQVLQQSEYLVEMDFRLVNMELGL